MDLDHQVSAVRTLARLSRFLERGSSELSLAHYRVLSAIEAGDERATRVASRLAVGKPTISAAVDSLTRRGLLARTDVDHDHRAASLKLTAAGSEVLRRSEAEMAQRISELLVHVTDPAGVVQSLDQIGVALDDWLAERAAQPA